MDHKNQDQAADIQRVPHEVDAAMLNTTAHVRTAASKVDQGPIVVLYLVDGITPVLREYMDGVHVGMRPDIALGLGLEIIRQAHMALAIARTTTYILMEQEDQPVPGTWYALDQVQAARSLAHDMVCDCQINPPQAFALFAHGNVGHEDAPSQAEQEAMQRQAASAEPADVQTDNLDQEGPAVFGTRQKGNRNVH